MAEVNQAGWTSTIGGATFTLTSGQERVAFAGEAGTLLPGQTEVRRENLQRNVTVTARLTGPPCPSPTGPTAATRSSC